MRLISALLLLCLGVPAPVSTNEGAPVLMIGDSHCEGATLYLSNLPKSSSKSLFPGGVASNCRRGTSIRLWSAGGEGERIITKWGQKGGTVVVYLGTNDIDSPVPPVDALVSSIEKSGNRCVWVGPSNWRGKGELWQQSLEVALAGRCSPIEMWSIQPGPDGVHLTPAGYGEVIKRVAQHAKK